MTEELLPREPGLPYFAATENVMTQEVQSDDVYFVSPLKYRTVMIEIFSKVMARELEEAEDAASDVEYPWPL